MKDYITATERLNFKRKYRLFNYLRLKWEL